MVVGDEEEGGGGGGGNRGSERNLGLGFQKGVDRAKKRGSCCVASAVVANGGWRRIEQNLQRQRELEEACGRWGLSLMSGLKRGKGVKRQLNFKNRKLGLLVMK